MVSVANPNRANIWSADYGESELQYGGKIEVYLQMPLMTWFAATVALAGVAVGAATSSEEVLETSAKAAMRLFEAADEDDSIYGGLTLGVAYNDDATLREVPGAIGHYHTYMRLRFFY